MYRKVPLARSPDCAQHGLYTTECIRDLHAYKLESSMADIAVMAGRHRTFSTGSDLEVPRTLRKALRVQGTTPAVLLAYNKFLVYQYQCTYERIRSTSRPPGHENRALLLPSMLSYYLYGMHVVGCSNGSSASFGVGVVSGGKRASCTTTSHLVTIEVFFCLSREGQH
jgi:hypothetical protein